MVVTDARGGMVVVKRYQKGGDAVKASTVGSE